MDIACATYEGVSFELDLFPRTKEPVWILGKKYITDRGNDCCSLLSVYRKFLAYFKTNRLRERNKINEIYFQASSINSLIH